MIFDVGVFQVGGYKEVAQPTQGLVQSQESSTPGADELPVVLACAARSADGDSASWALNSAELGAVFLLTGSTKQVLPLAVATEGVLASNGVTAA